MCPQISENLLIEIYVEVDDFLKAFELWSEQKALAPKRQPTRTPCLRIFTFPNNRPSLNRFGDILATVCNVEHTRYPILCTGWLTFFPP
jgi:hypothetical protein